MPSPDSHDTPDAQPSSPTPGRWIGPLKVLCGVALIGLLAWQASQADGFARLASGPKDFGLLAVALALVVISVVMTFLRWWLVASAADVPMSFAESLRFGTIGFAMNFVALGNIGGDVVKAALLARGRPGRRAVAVTTVMVDRLLGLFGLLLFASGAILISGALASELPTAVKILCQSTLMVTAFAIACVALAVAPGKMAQRLVLGLSRLPLIRSSSALTRVAEKVTKACDLYQRHRGRLAGALAVGLCCDAMFILSFYMVARGLPMASPGMVPHFFIVPLGLIAGAVPISPNGLGTVEATVEMLYRSFGSGVHPGDGALVAFGHRLVMLMAGATAVVYYVLEGRRKRVGIERDDGACNFRASPSAARLESGGDSAFKGKVALGPFVKRRRRAEWRLCL